jgi:23S rRNA (adenine-C8)-methyltransferase
MEKVMSQTKYDRLHDWIFERKLPSYRFAQIAQAIFRERITEFDHMIALPKQMRRELVADSTKASSWIKPIAANHAQQAHKISIRAG